MDAILQPAHLRALAWLVAGLVLSAIETLAPGVSVLIKRVLATKFDLPSGGRLRGRRAFA
jgi:membrane protein implicated in regulation of membrane protease activity